MDVPTCPNCLKTLGTHHTCHPTNIPAVPEEDPFVPPETLMGQLAFFYLEGNWTWDADPHLNERFCFLDVVDPFSLPDEFESYEFQSYGAKLYSHQTGGVFGNVFAILEFFDDDETVLGHPLMFYSRLTEEGHWRLHVESAEKSHVWKSPSTTGIPVKKIFWHDPKTQTFKWLLDEIRAFTRAKAVTKMQGPGYSMAWRIMEDLLPPISNRTPNSVHCEYLELLAHP